MNTQRQAICRRAWRACGGGLSSGEKRGRPRERIPDSLWAAAVKMAGTYGLYRTARALPVEYYSLKKRVEQQSACRAGSMNQALWPHSWNCRPMPRQRQCDCTLELEDTAGSKMRVHLKAAAPPDLAALCRSFWNPAS